MVSLDSEEFYIKERAKRKKGKEMLRMHVRNIFSLLYNFV